MRAVFLRCRSIAMRSLKCCAVALLAAGLLLAVGMAQTRIAQAWFVSIDGSVSPLSEPLSGRIKIASGIARGHWQFEGSVSFVPTEEFVLYKGNSGNVVEFSQNYPVFLGAGRVTMFFAHAFREAT